MGDAQLARQFFRLIGLDDVIVAASVVSPQSRLQIVVGGDEDYLGGIAARGADGLAKGDAVHAGHLDIQQQHVRRLVHGGQASRAAIEIGHLEAELLKMEAGDQAGRMIVVDDEDLKAIAQASSPSRLSRAGGLDDWRDGPPPPDGRHALIPGLHR